MAFDFPNSPTNGQVFTPPGGPTYSYDLPGTKWLVTGTGLSGMPGASQAEVEAGTSTSAAVTPGVQQYHPSAAKGWAYFGSTGVVAAGYNVTSITDNAVGDATVNWGVDFSSGLFAAVVAAQYDGGFLSYQAYTQSAGATRVTSHNMTTSVDPNSYSVVAYGDQ